MNKNLEKYTKAELISKLEKLNKLDQQNSVKTKDSNSIKDNSIKTSPTFFDIILKFKIWILSISVITILMQIFKKYKTIRAVLKLANYIIVTMFGLSIFEAFGFSFLFKFYTELRYNFTSFINLFQKRGGY